MTAPTPERTCGQTYGFQSRTGHPCARTTTHSPDDAYGHICRCEAENYLETHAIPCGTPRFRVSA